MSAARSSRRSWYTASRLVTVGLSSRSGVQFGLSATLDCLEHGAEAVLAGHRQVLVEADRGNEVRLGRHDLARRAVGINPQQHGDDRSEEHTSELQSIMRIQYAVFCSKKKKHYNNNKSEL